MIINVLPSQIVVLFTLSFALSIVLARIWDVVGDSLRQICLFYMLSAFCQATSRYCVRSQQNKMLGNIAFDTANVTIMRFLWNHPTILTSL